MTGLPTVQVLLDNGTGTFPFDITTKVLQINGFTFKRGRDDWQEAVTAGDLQSLTLINSDGRFTPGSTHYATPSPIKVDQQIRIKETVNGTTFTRFTGYVKGWPVSWPAVVATHSTVTITATDAQARAERRVLRSVVDEELNELSVSMHYPLSEETGATKATDTSGGQAQPLLPTGPGAAIVFGTEPGPASVGTAATFSAGQYLATSGDTFSTSTGTWVVAYKTSSAASPLLWGKSVDAFSSYSLLGLNAGTLYAQLSAGLTVNDGSGASNDDNWHTGIVTFGGGGGTFYRDGVPQSSFGYVGPLTWQALAGQGLTGDLAFLAFSPTEITDPQAANLSSVLLTNLSAGESGTARLTRLASYAGLTLGTLDASLTTVPFIDFTGRSVWDAIQEVADAELGSVYIDGSGNLTFHNRNETVAKTTPDLSIDRQYVSPDAQPTQDDQQIVNYLETTAAGTGVAQVVRDTSSEDAHGRYPDSKTYLVQTDAEALDRGNWIVDNFAEPSTRFGTLTIDLMKMTAAQAAAALTAVDLDAWIRVTNFPSQTPDSTTVDVIVQGFSEEVTDTTWKLSCNVVARSLFSPVWILGSSALGADTRLYV